MPDQLALFAEPKPKPKEKPDVERYRRPEWHKWVYGGQEMPKPKRRGD